MGLGLRGSVLVPSFLVFLLCSLVPAYFLQVPRGRPFPAAAYATSFAYNPIALVFPIVVTVPYVLFFGTLVRHRFLTYTRVRASWRVSLAKHLVVNSVLTFVSFFVCGMVPYLFIVFGDYSYSPGNYYWETPQQIAQAEQSWVTFSQFTAYGEWAFPVAFSVWLGLNAVVYSCISLCLSLLVVNRLVPIVLPWLVSLAATVVCAVLKLEAFSPGLIFPFNLTQLPLTNLLPSFGVTFAVMVLLLAYVFRRASSLPGVQ